MDEQNVYDLIVIGAGVAGSSAAMYASRLGMKATMIGELPGGLITTTHLVENWPGIKSISGPDLAMSLLDHAKEFGGDLVNAKVTSIVRAYDGDDKKSGYVVKTGSNEYKAKTVLLATGTMHRKMNVPGEDKLANKGVSYCALCDAGFYKGKEVSIVGSGDSAAKEALLLADITDKVYLFIRGDKLKAEPINTERVLKNSKIEVRYNTEIAEVLGDEKVEGVKLKSGDEIELSAVFVAIGHTALSELATELGVELNERKEIKINRHSETNLPGIYAAGDVTDTGFKQAITGSAEGVTAAYYASEYVGSNEIAV